MYLFMCKLFYLCSLVSFFVGGCKVCPYDEALYTSSRTESSSSSKLPHALISDDVNGIEY